MKKKRDYGEEKRRRNKVFINILEIFYKTCM